MGILNSKEVVLDTILTTEGRRQIAHSSLNASYYSFTDMGALYALDTIVSGTLSAGGLSFNETYRICLEATNLPQDIIVYETDDSGKLNANPPNTSGISPMNVRSGKLFMITGSNQISEVIDNDVFASLSTGVVSSSVNAFINQMILTSPDPMDDTERTFQIGPQAVQYNITPTKPMSYNQISSVNVNLAESFFLDKRLSNVANFKFLPPINKVAYGQSSENSKPIGEYKQLNESPILQYNPDIKNELDAFEQSGYHDEIMFTETSKENNLVLQFFEMKNNSIGKLDIIDFGAFEDIDKQGNTITKHVFYCGKIFIDSNKSPTYINLFTLVFDIDGGATKSS